MKIALVTAAAITGAVTASGGAAYALTGSTDTVVTAKVANHQDSGHGNITGKLPSKLTAAIKCHVKGTNRDRWTVKNVAGGRTVRFSYRVRGSGAWASVASTTVKAGRSKVVTTATGGYLSVHYYDGYGKSVWINARSVYKTVCK